MKRLLLIVDPQVDFIAGTLPVPGAEEAMDRLAEYIYESDGRYAHKIVTADRHPYDHCSFDGHGGPWPRHCVHDTVGAAVWQHLLHRYIQPLALSRFYIKVRTAMRRNIPSLKIAVQPRG